MKLAMKEYIQNAVIQIKETISKTARDTAKMVPQQIEAEV